MSNFSYQSGKKDFFILTTRYFFFKEDNGRSQHVMGHGSFEVVDLSHSIQRARNLLSLTYKTMYNFEHLLFQLRTGQSISECNEAP